jgi:3-hydroxyisobutyrate dehydrogenase
MSSVTSSDPVIVAVLGTGIMGAPIALNLARKGFAVRAWNRTGGRAEALSRDRIAVFDAPAKAVTGARIVITMLKDGDSVRQTMEAASPNLVKGVIWLQLSTVGVEAIDALAMFASGLGAVFSMPPSRVRDSLPNRAN